PADRARSRGAPLRLRPRLRGDRRRPRLERYRRTSGRFLRNPTPPQEGAPVTVSPDLDRRFRDAATREGLVDVAYELHDTPLGTLLLAATDRGLCRIVYDAEPERELELLGRAFGLRVLRSSLP